MAHLVPNIPCAIGAFCQWLDQPGYHLGLEPIKADDFFCGLVFLRAEHDGFRPHMVGLYCDFDNAAAIAEAEDIGPGGSEMTSSPPIDLSIVSQPPEPENAVRSEVSRRSEAFFDSNGKAA